MSFQQFLNKPQLLSHYTQPNSIISRIPMPNQTQSTTQMEVQCQRLQQDEFQVLSYIYLDQFHIIKEHYPYKFTVMLRPYSPVHQFEYQLSLHLEFTKTYPKTPLRYEIEPVTGITRDNMTSITKKIEDIIYQNRDKPIVYQIVQEVRLWIFQFLVEGRAYQSIDEVQKKTQEFFERPKFSAFTPVTIESFTAWKKQFDQKHKPKKVEKKQGQIKVSGKQWFLGKKQGEIEQSEEQQSDDQDFEEEEDDDVRKNFDQPQNKLFTMDQEQQTAQINN